MVIFVPLQMGGPTNTSLIWPMVGTTSLIEFFDTIISNGTESNASFYDFCYSICGNFYVPRPSTSVYWQRQTKIMKVQINVVLSFRLGNSQSVFSCWIRLLPALFYSYKESFRFHSSFVKVVFSETRIHVKIPLEIGPFALARAVVPASLYLVEVFSWQLKRTFWHENLATYNFVFQVCFSQLKEFRTLRLMCQGKLPEVRKIPSVSWY